MAANTRFRHRMSRQSCCYHIDSSRLLPFPFYLRYGWSDPSSALQMHSVYLIKQIYSFGPLSASWAQDGTHITTCFLLGLSFLSVLFSFHAIRHDVLLQIHTEFRRHDWPAPISKVYGQACSRIWCLVQSSSYSHPHIANLMKSFGTFAFLLSLVSHFFYFFFCFWARMSRSQPDRSLTGIGAWHARSEMRFTDDGMRIGVITSFL